MFPLRDENPHPPGFKPKLTIAFIIVNVIVFFYEVAYTGNLQKDSFTNGALFHYTVRFHQCLSLVTSVFLHGGLMHLGGNMLFLGDNIEHKFGRRWHGEL